MELDKLAEELSQKHVARSLEEMSDVEKIARWKTGERAAEQVDEILQPFVDEALEVIEQRSKHNASDKQ